MTNPTHDQTHDPQLRPLHPQLRPLSPSLGERFMNDGTPDQLPTPMLPFIYRIAAMNETFKLPSNTTLTNQSNDRLDAFYTVISDELSELCEVDMDCPTVDQYVALADCLGDLVVYIFSEARRWGIPLLDVLHIIMDSQDSKLVDGQPLMAPDGSKFIKGPNYVPPEPQIRALLESKQ